jgi:hypothetical protein
MEKNDVQEQQKLDEIDVVEVTDEVAPELTLYADWLTYEVVPGGPGK